MQNDIITRFVHEPEKDNVSLYEVFDFGANTFAINITMRNRLEEKCTVSIQTPDGKFAFLADEKMTGAPFEPIQGGFYGSSPAELEKQTEIIHRCADHLKDFVRKVYSVPTEKETTKHIRIPDMIKTLREEITSGILAILNDTGVGDFDTADLDQDYSPVILEDALDSDGHYTLDRIEADFPEGKIYFDASSSYNNICYSNEEVEIESLAAVLEYLEDHREALQTLGTQKDENKKPDYPSDDKNPFGIPDLKPMLTKVTAFVKKHQGDKGYIDTQNQNADSIYGQVFVPSEGTYAEGHVKAVRVQRLKVKENSPEIDILQVLMDDYRKNYSEEDIRKTPYQKSLFGSWLDADDTCDDVNYIPTLFNIATFIQEYV